MYTRGIRGDLASPLLTRKQVTVLVTNGGYGTVQQSLRAGVPMIMSGVGQDKLHTGALINYKGFGIYHALPQVTAELLTDDFDKILGNQTYRYILFSFLLLQDCVRRSRANEE
jgi:UDP:flavonoid glycosyltransferase YjiC (YdhE family)